MQNTKQYITETEGGYELCITLDNEQCAGVNVESITMFISNVNDAEDGDEACYYDGDLAVNYNIDTLQNDETAQTMGTLLVRNIHSEDEVTAVMGQFYWEGAFTQRLNAILVEHGFTANTVHTSEWGMQDEGRASYDACELADEIRNIMQTATA
jgi:O-methyltransferase involved in polyketide biosynthesis